MCIRDRLTTLENEAELAAVLGHEIVHAAARHGAKAQERGTFMQIGMVAAQVGMAMSDTNPNVGNLLLQGAGLGAQMAMMKYGRDAEPVSYTHLRAPETLLDLVSRLLLEKKQHTSPLVFSSSCMCIHSIFSCSLIYFTLFVLFVYSVVAPCSVCCFFF